jgi:hypothetical protein
VYKLIVFERKYYGKEPMRVHDAILYKLLNVD